MIPGSGSSSGQGIGYPLQYSWASLVVQVVKNLPAVQETWVQPLGWEDLLEEGLATYYSILAWRIPMGRELSMGSERVGYDLATKYIGQQWGRIIAGMRKFGGYLTGLWSCFHGCIDILTHQL